jgi:hypothetical protein
MCQYSSRCPVGKHRPGTVCRYAATNGGLAIIAILIVVLLVAKSQGWI